MCVSLLLLVAVSSILASAPRMRSRAGIEKRCNQRKAIGQPARADGTMKIPCPSVFVTVFLSWISAHPILQGQTASRHSLGSEDEAEFSQAEVDGARAFLKQHFTSSQSGMVIGLLDRQGSHVISSGGLGDGSGREVDGDTVFELGSVTKPFTVLLALDAERRGEVRLDDPVARHLPNQVKMPVFEGKDITLGHLAAQDSGLPFHPGNLNDWEKKGMTIQEALRTVNAYTAEDLYWFLPNCTLNVSPGMQFEYSNVGMALLGHALELKTGQSYEKLVTSRLCRPLGMEETRITLTAEMQTRLARGHLADGSPGENLKMQVLAPAGALLSTTNDMLKFAAANLQFSRSELSPLLARMQVRLHKGAARFGATAMPWFDEDVYRPPGSDVMGHSGGGFGYLAFIGFDLKKKRAVVVMSNQMALRGPAVGWTLLQGMPLTMENVTFLVREVVGLGVAFDADEESGLLRITKVFADSPGGRAGLKPGTLIQKIDDTPVKGRSTQECLALIKGAEGTLARLELLDAIGQPSRTAKLIRSRFLTSSKPVR